MAGKNGNLVTSLRQFHRELGLTKKREMPEEEAIPQWSEEYSLQNVYDIVGKISTAGAIGGLSGETGSPISGMVV